MEISELNAKPPRPLQGEDSIQIRVAGLMDLKEILRRLDRQHEAELAS